MKKLGSLVILVFITLVFIACEFPFTQTGPVSTMTTTATTTTEAPATTEHISSHTINQTTTIPTMPDTATTTAAGGITIVFSDYQDLLDQLYAMVYQDIYDQLYAEFGFDELIDEALYEEIYSQVETLFADLLDSGQLLLYVDDVQQMLYEVADLSQTSVVGVTSYLGSTAQSLGSGVIYKYDAEQDLYYVITNEHVIDDGDNFRIVFVDGSYVVGTLVGDDATVDIAVLTFSGATLDREVTVSVLGNSASLPIGSFVIAAGNPKGYDFYGSVTIGILSGKDRNLSTPGVTYLQHDASINSGNSGGPLYNLQGEVIGINVAKYATSDIEGMGFAIPIDRVKTVVAAIEAGN